MCFSIKNTYRFALSFAWQRLGFDQCFVNLNIQILNFYKILIIIIIY
jgi:hypothetical protein